MLKKQKGFSLFLFLFGSAFFGFAAAFFTFVIFPQLSDWYRMQDWKPVNATIISAKLNSNYSDGSTTYSVSAKYSYEYQGRAYKNNRVSISEGNDNIGSYQEDLFRRVERQRNDDEPVRIWIDPNNPSDSIIDRGMRWGLFAFEMVFVVIFGGIGGVVIAVSIFSKMKLGRNRKAKVIRNENTIDNYDSENPPVIRSNVIGRFIGAWLFTIVWNGIAAPATIFAMQEYMEKQEPLLLLVLLFPAVGVWLFVYAFKSTMEFIRFGRMELIPDPYPGSIGGNVGGTIELKEEYNLATKYELSLSCIHVYYTTSGTGKNRSRSKHEKLVWQRDGVAKSDSCDVGTSLEFCFDIPENLPASSGDSDDYHEWRLGLKADLPGVDLDREFTIPVETGIRESNAHIQQAQVVSSPEDMEIPEKFLQIQDTLEGVELYYPPLKSGLYSVFKLLLGMAFVGFISWIGFSAAKTTEEISLFIYFFVAVFGLIIALGIGFSLYQLLHTLKITIGGGRVVSVSQMLFPIKTKQIVIYEIKKVEKSKSFQANSAGSTPAAYYKIEAIGINGEKVCVARGVKGEQLADAIIAKIEGYI